MFGILFGWVINLLLLSVLRAPPLIHIIVICTVALKMLRIKLLMFDETDSGPWFVRKTCSFLGFPIASRVHRRAEIVVARKYEESGMTPSGTAYGEKYWQEVELSDGQKFFSPFEAFFFGHKRLSKAMEAFL